MASRVVGGRGRSDRSHLLAWYSHPPALGDWPTTVAASHQKVALRKLYTLHDRLVRWCTRTEHGWRLNLSRTPSSKEVPLPSVRSAVALEKVTRD